MMDFLKVPVVDVSSGLVSECFADALSLDVPPALGVGVPEAALDGIGLLHFGGTDGLLRIARPRPLPLSTRVPGEAFLVRAGPAQHDANGWEVFRVCVREPW